MSQTQFEAFALVELFGHTRMAGKVSEQAIGGTSFIRIDVPETKRQPTFSRLLNPSSIYAINPVSEEVMLELSESINHSPVQQWEIREVVAKAKEALELPKPPDFPEAPNGGYTGTEMEAMRQAEDDLNFDDDFQDEEEDDFPY